MTPEQMKNAGFYVLYALAGALVATGLQLATMLSGTGDLVLRPLLATFTTALFGALATAVGTSTLTRYGSEGIARQVNALRESGVHRKDMVVLPQDEAVAMAAGIPPVDPSLSPDETDHLLTLIRNVGPSRAIRALNDEQYRDPHREGAP